MIRIWALTGKQRSQERLLNVGVCRKEGFGTTCFLLENLHANEFERDTDKNQILRFKRTHRIMPHYLEPKKGYGGEHIEQAHVANGKTDLGSQPAGNRKRYECGAGKTGKFSADSQRVCTTKPYIMSAVPQLK